MKVLCALNKSSAGGLAIQRWPQIREHLDYLGVDYELLAPEARSLEEALADELRSRSDIEGIVGIGGDGTHSALIGQLFRLRHGPDALDVPPYTLVPLGTGNNLAKSFGMTRREDFFVTNLRRAVSAVCYGADYHVDVGKMGDQLFVDAFTIGLDPEILRERNLQKRRLEKIPILREFIRGNYLLYTWATSHRLLRTRLFEATVEVDGEIWHQGPLVNMLVNNTRIYGGLFDFSLDSYGNDGLMDVVLFDNQSDYLTKCFLSLRGNPDGVLKMNKKLFKVASHRQGKSIRIRCDRPQAAQVDGEELPPGDAFDIDVIPRAVHLKIPVEP